MTFSDDWLQGSFRGVPFELVGAELEDGRRKVVFQAPGRDAPFVQDLGRAVQKVRLEVFVIGGDYLSRRDRLLQALRRTGPGELSHPYYGTVQATPTEVRVTENNREAGMARLTLTFILGATEVAIGSSASGRQSAETAGEVVAQAAAQSVGLAGSPDRTGLELVDARTAVGDATQSLVDRIRSSISSLEVNLDATSAASLIRQIEDLGDIVLSDGGDFTRWLQGIQSGASFFGAGVLLRVGAVRSLLDFTIELLGLDRSESTDRVRVPVAASVLAAAAQEAAGVGTGWESRQEALKVREELLEVSKTVIERSDDVVGEAIADLRVAIIDAVPDPAAELPELGRYVPPAIEPAIVVAARLYSDPSRSDEIAMRNRVRHPGFVPASTPLEVLINV